jgi:uncharacterized protein YicC (UPF0701 family)
VPDVFTVAEKVNADDEEKKLVIEAIEEALKAHAAEKSREGKELQENLLKLINDLSRFANSVEEKVSNLQAKLQENLLKKNQEEILQQSSRLKAIFENSSHLVWTINKEYEIGFFNSNFANVYKESV